MAAAGPYGKSQGNRINLPVAPVVREAIEKLWRQQMGAGAPKRSEAQFTVDLIVLPWPSWSR